MCLRRSLPTGTSSALTNTGPQCAHRHKCTLRACGEQANSSYPTDPSERTISVTGNAPRLPHPRRRLCANSRPTDWFVGPPCSVCLYAIQERVSSNSWEAAGLYGTALGTERNWFVCVPPPGPVSSSAAVVSAKREVRQLPRIICSRVENGAPPLRFCLWQRVYTRAGPQLLCSSPKPISVPRYQP